MIDSPRDNLFAESEIAVLSPHLDDAALSLGASIARATSSGRTVRVVTVFAYDPDRVGPPQAWDAACGFRSLEEAARARRDEDARACEILGAEPVWLPFSDVEYEQDHDEDRVWPAILDAVGQASLVLIPGFPLAVPDHSWLTELILRRPPPATRIGLYVEQPYATWRRMSLGGRAGARGLSPWRGLANSLRISLRLSHAKRLQQPTLPGEIRRLLAQTPEWTAAPANRDQRRAKFRAIDQYESQLRGFGPLVTPRMRLYEAAWGGEGIARATTAG